MRGSPHGHLVYKDRTVLLKYHRLLDGAHRQPPNSLSALRRVLANSAEAIECDVRLTRDGVFVLLHDSTLERETTGQGPVNRITSDDFAALRLRGADEPPATLAEVVAILQRHRGLVKIQIDLTEEAPLSGDNPKALLDVLAPARANSCLRIVIGCGTHENVRALRRIDPALPVGLDIEAPIDAPAGELSHRLRLAEDVSEFYMPKAFVLRVLARGFNPIEFIHEHKPGALVDVWTFYAGEPDIVRNLSAVLDAGADQITTPTPILLAEVLSPNPAS